MAHLVALFVHFLFLQSCILISLPHQICCNGTRLLPGLQVATCLRLKLPKNVGGFVVSIEFRIHVTQTISVEWIFSESMWLMECKRLTETESQLPAPHEIQPHSSAKSGVEYQALWWIRAIHCSDWFSFCWFLLWRTSWQHSDSFREKQQTRYKTSDSKLSTQRHHCLHNLTYLRNRKTIHSSSFPAFTTLNTENAIGFCL